MRLPTARVLASLLTHILGSDDGVRLLATALYLLQRLKRHYPTNAASSLLLIDRAGGRNYSLSPRPCILCRVAGIFLPLPAQKCRTESVS
jgi:hypothetical protein